MRATTLHVVAAVILATLSVPALACNTGTGERSQIVAVSWNGTSLGTLTVDPSKIESIRIPNGFTLGLKIEPADATVYAEGRAVSAYSPELVKISLFDLAAKEPRLLTHTFAGANSIQGYGSGGGADRVVQLGDPGVILTLLKPVCVPTHATAQAH